MCRAPQDSAPWGTGWTPPDEGWSPVSPGEECFNGVELPAEGRDVGLYFGAGAVTDGGDQVSLGLEPFGLQVFKDEAKFITISGKGALPLLERRSVHGSV